ncbi:MAG: SDR family oxidoreductase [Planctomycetes bacterium]|nr:SDR family oxidoreductase [Planctomycetota bacterium]
MSQGSADCVLGRHRELTPRRECIIGIAMELANQTIALTGASSGIGAALARELSERGARVILIARRRDRMEALARELPSECDVWPSDLLDREAQRELIERLVEREVDGLVNNAGIGAAGHFWTHEPDRIDRIVELNIGVLVRLTRAVLPGMIERGGGFVFNVGSVAGFQGTPYMATYGATKSFVLDFTEALAVELVGTGVTTGVICPGSTRTEFFETNGVAAEKAYKVFESAEQVARNAVRAIEGRRVIRVSGWMNAVVAHASRCAPSVLRRWVAGRIMRGLNEGRD